MTFTDIALYSADITTLLMIIGGLGYYLITCIQSRIAICHPTDAVLSIIIGLPVSTLGLCWHLYRFYPYTPVSASVVMAVGGLFAGIAAGCLLRGRQFAAMAESERDVIRDRRLTGGLVQYVVQDVIGVFLGTLWGVPLLFAGAMALSQ